MSDVGSNGAVSLVARKVVLRAQRRSVAVSSTRYQPQSSADAVLKDLALVEVPLGEDEIRILVNSQGPAKDRSWFAPSAMRSILSREKTTWGGPLENGSQEPIVFVLPPDCTDPETKSGTCRDLAKWTDEKLAYLPRLTPNKSPHTISDIPDVVANEPFALGILPSVVLDGRRDNRVLEVSLANPSGERVELTRVLWAYLPLASEISRRWSVANHDFTECILPSLKGIATGRDGKREAEWEALRHAESKWWNESHGEDDMSRRYNREETNGLIIYRFKCPGKYGDFCRKMNLQAE